MSVDPRGLRPSATFPPHILAEIHRAADQGLYEIRGYGAKRQLPTFDDLVFLGASVSRYPLEGYREKCGTDVTIGARFAKKPIELKIPITIAGMSFGALGANAKQALGRGASAVGTSTTTGDCGMRGERRSGASRRFSSTRYCRRATDSTRAICAPARQSRSSSDRGPSREVA